MILEEGLSEGLLEKWKLLSKKELKEIVYGAALLHDIGRWQEYSTGKDHAEVSARLAQNLLIECDFNELERGIIVKAIREHRGEASEDKSILGKILCQADDLSRNCNGCSVWQECKSIKNPIIQY
jgi:HD superfamily phosphodiesterase